MSLSKTLQNVVAFYRDLEILRGKGQMIACWYRDELGDVWLVTDHIVPRRPGMNPCNQCGAMIEHDDGPYCYCPQCCNDLMIQVFPELYDKDYGLYLKSLGDE
jgi:hypothetical protein